MSRPTAPPEEFLRRENIMGVRKGVSAAHWTHLTAGPKCPDSLDAPRPRQRLFEEIVLVDVDQVRPEQHPDDASERQEDAERNCLLAARRTLTGDDENAYDRA